MSEIKNYWNDMHARDDKPMLTGSVGVNVWKNLDICHLIKPGEKILNIGVGLSFCTKALVDIGAIVDVLDISEIALNRVKDIVKNTYLAENIIQLPSNYYDLAISHLVAQHMSDIDFSIQLIEVIRSLKSGGVFAIQIVGKLDGTNGSDDLAHQKGGGVCRTLNKMTKLIEDAGGVIVMARRFSVCEQYRSYGYYIHIVRAE